MPKAPSTITAVTTTAPTNLSTAICAISQGLGVIAKQGFNDFHKYHFARMPDLLKSLAPLMAQHQVTCFQSETACHMIADGVLRCEYEFTFVHAPTGESRTIKSSGMSKVSGEKGGFNDRAIQAIATTARKYTMIQVFAAVVEDIADVDNATSARPKPRGKHEAAPIFQRLSDELAAITNLGDLQIYGDTYGLEIGQLPADWQKALRVRYAEKLREYKPAVNVTTIAPSPKRQLKESITERAIKNRNSLNLNDHNPY